MKKILFIAHSPADKAPSQRFRYEQYLPYLRQQGYQCDFAPLLNPSEHKIFYAKGNTLAKIFTILVAAVKRLHHVLCASKYDIVFIQREAFALGTTVFERGFKQSGAKLVFDFDDSIWLQNVSAQNRFWGFLKNANKTKDIIAMSDCVVAGNQYLADYASQYNSNVVIIPTTIDTNLYQPKTKIHSEVVNIGWSGSITTIQHFETAIPALLRIKEKYGSRVRFCVVGDGNYRHEALGIIGQPWQLQTELEDLQSMDIGLMPLPDDEWAKGKCGLKGLQYMAMGVATIMSPVGVNTTILQHGVNGLLAQTSDEWVACLSALIDDASLRLRIAQEGRETVVAHYSVASQQNNYLRLFESLVKQ